MRLVDLLELLLTQLFILRHVRMIFASQLAERLLDLVIARGSRHAQGDVIILELDGHGGKFLLAQIVDDDFGGTKNFLASTIATLGRFQYGMVGLG